MRITNAEQYGKAIRETRKFLKLTQGDVASACGTGIRFIVDLERGKPTCELGKALRVAQMLGILMEADLPVNSKGSSE
jgi:HTH-type transcriptional regulator/antitoxin HipB